MAKKDSYPTYEYIPLETKLPPGNDGTQFVGKISTQVGILLPKPIEQNPNRN